MKGKITFNKSGSGSISGRLNIPVAYLEIMEITKDEREITFSMEGKKLVIEKKENIK